MRLAEASQCLTAFLSCLIFWGSWQRRADYLRDPASERARFGLWRHNRRKHRKEKINKHRTNITESVVIKSWSAWKTGKFGEMLLGTPTPLWCCKCVTSWRSQKKRRQGEYVPVLFNKQVSQKDYLCCGVTLMMRRRLVCVDTSWYRLVRRGRSYDWLERKETSCRRSLCVRLLSEPTTTQKLMITREIHL